MKRKINDIAIKIIGVILTIVIMYIAFNIMKYVFIAMLWLIGIMFGIAIGAVLLTVVIGLILGAICYVVYFIGIIIEKIKKVMRKENKSNDK